MPYTTLIDTQTLAENLTSQHWVIIDARFSLTDTALERQEYETAHIPGAIYAHLDEDLSGPIIPGKTSRHPLPAIDTFAQTLSSWGINANSQVVVYDSRGGIVAARLWWMLRWLGHEAVAVLNGGWPQWVKEGHATKAGVEQGTPSQFVPKPQPGWVIEADEAAQVGQDSTAHLIDCRAYSRYRGDEEPLDPVGGHIPGAICAPVTENLAEDGLFRSEADLRQRFAALLGEIPPDKTVFYCGSGVSAAHNLLALAHIGLDGAKLYVGSWSEWITDPSRPIATGENS